MHKIILAIALLTADICYAEDVKLDFKTAFMNRGVKSYNRAVPHRAFAAAGEKIYSFASDADSLKHAVEVALLNCRKARGTNPHIPKCRILHKEARPAGSPKTSLYNVKFVFRKKK